MDDFNSETDSDYTSYWRDWEHVSGVTKPFAWTDQYDMSKRSISALSEDGIPSPKQTLPPNYPADFIERANKRVRQTLQDTNVNSIMDTVEPAWSGVCERHLRPLIGTEEDRVYLGKANPIYQNCIREQRLQPSSTPSETAYEPGLAIQLDEPFCEGFQFKLGFISSRGNEYFCEIDEEYLTDRFNLTGLNTEVQYYQYALDLVTDVFDLDCDDEMRETIEKSARHLYGLVHARYIVTTRGLGKMLDKYKKSDFGKCPRVMCKAHPLLPMGQSDNPNQKAVKLYCAKCEDIYNPKSSRHAAIDGAYFGTSFHNILFQVYPALIPPKSYDRYTPRIYGFKVHAPAALIRWQNAQRNDMRKRLRALEVESGFKEDEEDVDAEDSEEEDEDVDPEAMIENGMEDGEFNDGLL